MKSILQGIKSLNLLEQNLKLRAQKHLQIVSNIANSPNPDYKAFEMVLDVPGPGQGCYEALGELRAFDPEASVIMVTPRPIKGACLKGSG